MQADDDKKAEVELYYIQMQYIYNKYNTRIKTVVYIWGVGDVTSGFYLDTRWVQNVPSEK